MIRQEAKKILHEYLIRNKIFGNYHFTGEGSHGHSFVLNENQIIKITTDKKEIETAKYFNDNKHQSIVDYYDIEWIPESKCGVILMEKLEPLNIYVNEHKELIKNWHELINPDSSKKFGIKLEQCRMNILELRSKFDLDIRELHWGNCGVSEDGHLKFFDLKLN